MSSSEPTPQILVFDLDDTLYPEDAFVLSGFRVVDAWLARTHGVEGFFDRAEALHRSGKRGTVFDDTLAAMGALKGAELVPAMVEVYREHAPTIALFEDARWALDQFSTRCRLGLVTDGYLRTQQQKVRALSIEPWIECIVYTDAFGRSGWKPSPIGFEHLMRVMACVPSRCTYVADNPTKDFLAPNRLGWRTIQLARSGGFYEHAVPPTPEHRAQARVESLFDLGDLLVPT
jgi:putative hydrolase of the HAD superfamily